MILLITVKRAHIGKITDVRSWRFGQKSRIVCRNPYAQRYSRDCQLIVEIATVFLPNIRIEIHVVQ